MANEKIFEPIFEMACVDVVLYLSVFRDGLLELIREYTDSMNTMCQSCFKRLFLD